MPDEQPFSVLTPPAYGNTENPSPAPSPAPAAPPMNAVQALQKEAGFMDGLMNHDPRIRAPFLARWEAANKAISGAPADAPAAYAPAAQDTSDGARLEAELGPKSPSEYIFSGPPDANMDLGLPEFREQAFAAGVAPVVANNLWKSMPAIEAMDDTAYLASVRAAKEQILKMPDGRETLDLANAVLQKFSERSPLWQRAAIVAYASPHGLMEAARLGRRANR